MQLITPYQWWKVFWMRDFRLPPRIRRELRSSGLLRSVYGNYYRHNGTTYRSHLQGSIILGFLTLEDGTDRLSQHVDNNYHTRRVTAQNSAVLAFWMILDAVTSGWPKYPSMFHLPSMVEYRTHSSCAVNVVCVIRTFTCFATYFSILTHRLSPASIVFLQLIRTEFPHDRLWNSFGHQCS